MKRSKILNFISKYTLDGHIDSVRWDISDKKLATHFMSPTKSLMGHVTTELDYEEDAEIGIYETGKLNKMISILEEEIKMKLNKSQDSFKTIEFLDANTKIKYMLSELDIIERVSDIKYIPEFKLTVKITKDIISKFLKAKAAIDLSEYFYINCDILAETCRFILGEGTNQININVDFESEIDIQNLSFSTELFSAILSSNKDFEEASLKVSDEGLLHASFKNSEFTTDYYLVARIGDTDD